MEEQNYIEARRQLAQAARTLKESKKRLIKEYIQAHYPGVGFEVIPTGDIDMLSGDISLTFDINFFNIPEEQCIIWGSEIAAYIDEVNRRVHDGRNKFNL